MAKQLTHLQAVILDWAGTTVDFGCCAPAIVFQEIFRKRGVTATMEEVRGPMGRAKRDHIATVAALPSVSAQWQEKFGHACTEQEVDAMYVEFLPLQQSILGEHSDVIPGVAAAVDECRAMGLKIGSTTGYTHELMEVVSPIAAVQGYAPDCLFCAGDTARGRPAPYLIYRTAEALDIFPLSTIVKVDDTPVGIEAGRNAGCWTVGITATGNCVGLSESEWNELSDVDQAEKIAAATFELESAGAHFTLPSVADLPALLYQIDELHGEGQ